MKNRSIWVMFWVAILGYSVLGESNIPFFKSDGVLHLKLEGPIKKIIRDKAKDPEYRPCQLKYFQSDGVEMVLNVMVRARGHFRRNPRNCNFAPLKFNFQESPTEGTLFEGIGKLKLVSHCQTKRKIYQQYLIREYLVYRLFNILSPKSFRVRLAYISYVDTDKAKKKELKRYGFFIESPKMMAARNNAEYIRIDSSKPRSIDLDRSTLLSLFQFLIGNTDWSFNAEHNVKWLQPQGGGGTEAVPYDFDYAGIIFNHYAMPAPKLGISSVRDRRFIGLCRTPEEFQKSFDMYNAKKDEIISLYETFTLIKKGYRKKVIKFIKKFYKIINSPRQVKWQILDYCSQGK